MGGSRIQRRCAACARGEARCPACEEGNAGLDADSNPTWLRLTACVQKKLVIGAVDDPYEREADRVADQVSRMPDPPLQRQDEPEEEGAGTIQPQPITARASSATTLRLKCATCNHEQPVHRRDADEELEDTISVPGGASAARESPNVSMDASETTSAIDRARGQGGATLPEPVRAFMEPRFGHDFSDVRTHTDPSAAALADNLNARAFTVGQDIFFGRGEFQPETPSGQRLLAHELTHTLQQMSRVASYRIQRAVAFGRPCKKTLPTGQAREDVAFAAHDLALEVLRGALNEMTKKHPTDPEEEVAPDVLAAASARFSLPSLKNAKANDDTEGIKLWEDLFDVFGRMIEGAPSAKYRCRCPFPHAFAVTLPGKDDFRLCYPNFFINLNPDQRAGTLIHEWAHRFGPPVVRKVLESYCPQSKFAVLTREQLIQMPDAYMLFAWDLGGPAPLPCF